MNIKVLTTEKAISTYNFLVEEGRIVAAALIPPENVKIMDIDVVETKERCNFWQHQFALDNTFPGTENCCHIQITIGWVVVAEEKHNTVLVIHNFSHVSTSHCFQI